MFFGWFSLNSTSVPTLETSVLLCIQCTLPAASSESSGALSAEKFVSPSRRLAAEGDCLGKLGELLAV